MLFNNPSTELIEYGWELFCELKVVTFGRSFMTSLFKTLSDVFDIKTEFSFSCDLFDESLSLGKGIL